MKYIDFEKLDSLFEPEIGLYRSSKTIQVLLIRQTHDFSIFRTEETGELNIVTLPHHAEDNKPVVRVAMLASKQKAPESRHYVRLIRTIAGTENLSEDQAKCALKDHLCQKCPRCVLFGSVSTATGRGERFNIKHRVEYSTAYSIEPYEEISEIITFNAVDSINQSTGQALGYTENVSPLATFPSVVTMNSVTEEEFIMFIKALLSCKSYGAQTRVKGDMVNHLVGIVGGLEEIITPLDFVLHAAKEKERYLSDPITSTYDILKKFSEFAMFKNRLVLLDPKEITGLVDEIANMDITKEFGLELYKQAEAFTQKLEKYA